MRLLVAGGTGTAGRAVVQEAVRRGHDVRVLTHRAARPQGVPGDQVVPVHGDLVTGTGLDAAMEGVEAVVDVSNILATSRRRAAPFFTAGTIHLLAAGGPAGVRHHVLLSIVGVDGSPLGYYRAKVAQERCLAERAPAAGPGHTVARATQFHDFALQTLERSGGRRLVVVPGVRVQPVDVREVAAHLLRLAEGPAVGRAPDLAGPRVERLPELVQRVAARQGSRVRVVALPLPPGLRRSLLPQDGGLRGSGTFAQWLQRLPEGVSGR